MAGDEIVEREVAVDLAADRDLESHRFGRLEIVGEVGELGVDDDAVGTGVVDDGAHLTGRQRRVERDAVDARLLERQLPPDHVDAVRQCVGDDVAGAESVSPDRVDDLVGAAGELAERQGHAGRGFDDRGKVGMIVGDPPDTESLIPRRHVKEYTESTVGEPNGAADRCARRVSAFEGEPFTMDCQTITFEVGDDHVATITLDRPDALNSFNDEMAAELTWAWETVRDTDDIHAVVLQANGERAFSTGLDTKSDGRWFVSSNVWNTFDPGATLSPKFHHKVWKPVVAAVHGMCAGGGQYFINEADIIICSDDALFFDPARQRGDRVGARADRHARPRRPPRRRAALGADGFGRADHRRDRAAHRPRQRGGAP